MEAHKLSAPEKVSVAARLVFILVGLTFLTPVAFHSAGVSDTITLAVLGIYTAFGVSFDIMNFKHSKLKLEKDEALK